MMIPTSAASFSSHSSKSVGIIKGLTYTIADRLYVSLTNNVQANVRTLMQTRGPSFAFSLEKVSREPSVEEVCRVIDEYYNSEGKIVVGMGENDEGITFAGVGEPLLRVSELEEIVDKVRQKRHGAVMRLITNGVHDVSVAERAAKLKLDKYTVALTSADPVQWKRLTYADDTNDERQHGADFTLSEWCAFVDALTQSGRKVEVTTPVAPGVDVNLARELAMSLGAVEFRTREYFA